MKVYLIYDGNDIIDITNDRYVAVETKEWLTSKYKERWLNYSIIQLEADGDYSQEDVNTITVLSLNKEPIKAFINKKEIQLLNGSYDDYRKYTYEVHPFIMIKYGNRDNMLMIN